MDAKVTAPSLDDILDDTHYYGEIGYYNGSSPKDDDDSPDHILYSTYILHHSHREGPYLYPIKPPVVSSILHFRIRQLFKSLDPHETGFVKVELLIQHLPKLIPCISEATIGHITTSLLQPNTGSASPGFVTLPQFYHVLDSISHLILADRDNMLLLTPHFKQLIDFIDEHTIPKDQQYPTNVDPSSVRSRQLIKDGTGIGFTPRQLELMKSLEDRSIAIHHDSTDNILAVKQSDHIKLQKISDKLIKRRKACRRCLSYITCPCPSNQLPCFKSCNTRVSAKFGSSFHQFFNFIGSLIWLNVLLAAVLAVLFISSAISFDWSFGPITTTRYINGESVNYTIYPKPEGFLYGLGMEHSFLFYSDYYQVGDYIGAIRIDTLWTILVGASLFVGMLYVLSHISLSSSHTKSPQEKLVQTVFSFDHAPRSPQSYRLQSLHLRSSLLSIVSQLQESVAGIRTQLLIQQRYRIRFRRAFGILINTLVLAAISIGIIMLIINEKSIEQEITGYASIPFSSQVSVPLFISCLKVVIPIIVKMIVKFEQRPSSDAFKHITLRIFIMKMFSLLIVLFQTQSTALGVSELATINCRQTLTGVMFYRMIITDIFIEGFCALLLPLIMMLFTFIYHTIFRIPPIPKLKTHPTRAEVDEHLYLSSVGVNKIDLYKSEFEVTENTIDLLYAQSLIWFALPYSHAIPYIGILYFFCILCFKYVHVLLFSRISRVTVPRSIQENYVNMFLLVSLALAMIPFTVYFTTGVGCGPHYYNPFSTSNLNTPVYGFSHWVEGFPHVLTIIAHSIQSPIVLLGLFGLLIFIGAKHRSSYSGHENDIKTIRLWLALERQQMKSVRKQYHIETKSPVVGTRLMIEFIQSLPDQVQLSLQTYLSRQYFNDLFYLLLLDRDEVVKLLQDWNPMLKPDDTMIQYILLVLDQYRKQLSI